MPNYRKRFLRFVVAGFAIFALIIIILIILGPIRFGDGVIQQTSLPDELLPTAEYVFYTVNPDQKVRLRDDVSVSLDLSWISNNGYTHIFCVNGGFVPQGHNYTQNSRIIVNGTWVRGAMNSYLLLGLDGHEPLNLCVEGNLESGLHLIEFQLRDSFWGEPIATQQWVIEVE